MREVAATDDLSAAEVFGMTSVLASWRFLGSLSGVTDTRYHTFLPLTTPEQRNGEKREITRKTRYFPRIWPSVRKWRKCWG